MRSSGSASSRRTPFTFAMGEIDGVECDGQPDRLHGRARASSCCRWPRTPAALWDASARARRRAVRPRRARHAAARGLLPAARQRHHARRRTRSRPGSAGPARSTRSSPASRSCAEIKERGPERRLVAFVMEEKAIPRQGMPIEERRRGHLRARTRRCSSVGIGLGYVPARPRRAGHRAHDRRARPAAPRRASSRSRSTSERSALVAAAESYPDELQVPPRARLGAHRGRRGDARDHLVRAGRARRARPLRAARGGRADREGRDVRRGRVGQGRLGRDLAALGRGARGQPEGRRRARDGQRGSRTARAGSSASGSTDPSEVDALLDAEAYRSGRRMTPERVSLPLADRRATARRCSPTIGVSSVDELFARHSRRRALRPRARPRAGALRAGARRAPEELAARNVDTGVELSFLGAGHLRPLRPGGRRRRARARRAADRVHAVPARDEPGRAAGDLRVPDRDLRADRDGRLERVGLRRHDRRGRRLLRREARDRALEGRASPRR